ncbi:MAG: MFS transporter, partial [Gammaproteobacteria bacterium]|nr:MFS transporter [Gammaproteobacteria bacterium]
MTKKAGLARQATRNVNRAEVVDRNFMTFLDEWDIEAEDRLADGDAVHPGKRLNASDFRALFESQMESRHLDLEARAMRSRNEGFYTIGSSGHECNSV